jgi:hypothetical protein
MHILSQRTGFPHPFFLVHELELELVGELKLFEKPLRTLTISQHFYIIENVPHNLVHLGKALLSQSDRNLQLSETVEDVLAGAGKGGRKPFANQVREDGTFSLMADQIGNI